MRNGSGALGILLFMAKRTLGILDGGGWGCRRVDDGLWAGLNSSSLSHATSSAGLLEYSRIQTKRRRVDARNHDYRNHEQTLKVLRFKVPVNKQVLSTV